MYKRIVRMYVCALNLNMMYRICMHVLCMYKCYVTVCMYVMKVYVCYVMFCVYIMLYMYVCAVCYAMYVCYVIVCMYVMYECVMSMYVRCVCM